MPKAAYTEDEHASIQPALGEAIKTRRLALGLTAAQLSWQAGRSERLISYIESGSTLVSLPALVQLCRALGCTPNDLLGWEES